MTAASHRSPTISVIINTDGRRKALQDTIEGLRRLNYQNFEVCVVCGPTPDGTREYVQSLGDLVKSADCPIRNLSMSRNIGIGLACGEIVAFIDDDGVPEPEWLDQLAIPFDDPAVGGAGGVVYNHTGYEFQYLYAACDRLGNATTNLIAPASDLNFPFSRKFPYVQGTNSAFRRTSLVGLGGFDEEYEFYLDETDVCCRMVDRGLLIAQLADARVHHKFLPSHIRNNDRVTVKKYAVLKNKIYFSLINSVRHYSLTEIMADALHFVSAQRADIEFHVNAGRLSHDDLNTFDEEAERAWQVGLSRGLSGERRTRPPEWFAQGGDFQPFKTLRPDRQKLTLLFLSQTYPPGEMGGIARYTYDCARAIAAKGHNVHVLTAGREFNRVDLEEGVWVHRIVPKEQPAKTLPDGRAIPQRVWNYSATMLEEALRISQSRPIDAVEGVSWDCETAAFIFDGRFPTATNVVTSLAHWLETHPEQRSDPQWMASFGDPMLTLERLVYDGSDRIVAASEAIVGSLREYYGSALSADRVARCPHGLEDMAALPKAAPKGLKDSSPKATRILFVGRLELRKGIDTLLEAALQVLSARDNIEFWIAGDNTLVTDNGKTAQQIFEDAGGDAHVGKAVRFLGPVDDAELRWLYQNCDIFAAPSRFESFGLIYIEAMIFAKPSIGCRAGAVTEVVSQGETGLLVEPGDSQGLAKALLQLTDDAKLRKSLGDKGRKTYEQKYTSAVVAEQRIHLLQHIVRAPVPDERRTIEGAHRFIPLDDRSTGLLLESGGAVAYDGVNGGLYISFFRHDWSGVAEIRVNGEPVLQQNLFNAERDLLTLHVTAPAPRSRIEIARTDRKDPASKAAEVIVASVREGGA